MSGLHGHVRPPRKRGVRLVHLNVRLQPAFLAAFKELVELEQSRQPGRKISQGYELERRLLLQSPELRQLYSRHKS